MRGAFGKPQGTCARVAIGQILLSIRCKDVHNPQVCPTFVACTSLQSRAPCKLSVFHVEPVQYSFTHCGVVVTAPVWVIAQLTKLVSM